MRQRNSPQLHEGIYRYIAAATAPHGFGAMKIELNEVGSRLRLLAEFANVELSDAELSQITERYASCPGEDPWEVREYVRQGADGAREYHVVRGAGARDVYTSIERARADTVRVALNGIEARQASNPTDFP